jgi:hypothetical protein
MGCGYLHETWIEGVMKDYKGGRTPGFLPMASAANISKTGKAATQ